MEIIETTVSDKIGCNGEIASLHSLEVGASKYEPDVKTLEAMENAGVLLGLAAYDGDKLVGYSVNIIGPDVSRCGKIVCSNHTLFVRADYRKSGLGLRIIKATEEAAKARGASCLEMQGVAGSPVCKLFSRKGFTETYTIFRKEL